MPQSVAMRFAFFLPVILLAACSLEGVSPARPAQPSQPLVPPPGVDTCQAGPYARLVGQDATALERELILRQVRVIRPGDAVTRDYRPVRLNFEIGTDGRIVRIFCG